MDWQSLHAPIARAVASLPEQGFLLVVRESPEALMEFSRGRAVLRCEACNEQPGDEPRLGARGWELIDEWAGRWRREVPWPGVAEEFEQAVAEATFAMRAVWGIARPDGFTYLAWQEQPPRAAWQFWKSDKDPDLSFPELGLPRGKADRD